MSMLLWYIFMSQFYVIFSGIHGYIVNDRLFAKPINVDDVGQSICPVCLVPRKEPTAEEPGFVR